MIIKSLGWRDAMFKRYQENPKESTNKLVELQNEFSKVTEHKNNSQNTTEFLDTSSEHMERN